MRKNDVQPRMIYLDEGSKIPNNPSLPVLVYKRFLDPQTADKEKVFQHQFEENGWKGIWKNGIFDYHHFHPDAHEALGIARGRVTVQLGGEDGETLELEAGDLVVLPAGTGHKKLLGSESLLVVGAYPEGQEHFSTARSLQEAEGSHPKEKIIKTPVPQTDPLYGAKGPLPQLWGNESRG